MYEYLYGLLRNSRRNPELPLRRLTYFTQLLDIRVSMFAYTCPRDVEPVWIERYLSCSGSILGGKVDGRTIITPAPAREGDLDIYGDGTIGYGVPRNGDPELRGIIGEDVAICYNMSSRAPDLDLLYYPELLAEIDKSMQEIIEQCRVAPLICASNSIVKDAIQQALKQLRSGEPQVILDDNTLRELQKISNSPGVYSVHMVDPDYTHNAQYLAELWDVVLRRYCNMIGIDTRKTTKHAQVSTEEATGLDAVSWILPLDMLRCRQRFCADMQRITGDSWGVSLSEAWQIEYDKYRTELAQKIADVEVTEAEAEADLGEDQREEAQDDDT